MKMTGNRSQNCKYTLFLYYSRRLGKYRIKCILRRRSEITIDYYSLSNHTRSIRFVVNYPCKNNILRGSPFTDK